MKKVVSLALSEKALEKVDTTAKALGMNRSELVEYMINKGFHFSDEAKDTVEHIKELQKKATEMVKK